MPRTRAGADHTERHNQVVQAIRQYMAWSKAWNLKVAGGVFQRKGIPDILACWQFSCLYPRYVLLSL